MRKPWVAAAVVLLTTTAPAVFAGVDLRLRVAGGAARLALDEPNTVLREWEAWHVKTVEDSKNMTLVDDKVGELRLGYDFDVEMILGFGRHFGLGFGAGVLNASVSEKDAFLTVDRPLGTFTYAHTMTASAYPVLLSAHGLLPLGGKFTAYVKAGGGLAWAKFAEREANKLPTNPKFAYPFSQSARANGTVYAAGVGLRFDADDKLSFLVEFGGRRGELTDFEGKAKDGTPGALYAFDEYDAKIEHWRRRYEILAQPPQGDIYRNVGKARIDIGGVSVKLGIALEF